MTNDYDLDNAYEIKKPEDAKNLYDDWAETYDSSFAEDWGYVAPAAIAGIFKELAAPENSPILDIGAGTGLVAAALDGMMVDGIDISAEMLAIAASKGLYRNRYEADLTKPLALANGTYGGFVSCGTFTHGHVGPECLPELLRVAKPGALFCCGTIPAVYDGAGFGSAFARLVAAKRITPVDFREIGIYQDAGHDHAKDRGLVAVFRKQAG
ncbi:MAG: methyltransferase domain-containing protein [Pseudomonadota bacterium]